MKQRKYTLVSYKYSKPKHSFLEVKQRLQFNPLNCKIRIDFIEYFHIWMCFRSNIESLTINLANLIELFTKKKSVVTILNQNPKSSQGTLIGLFVKIKIKIVS